MGTSTIDELFNAACSRLKAYNKELNEKFNQLSNNFLRFRFVWLLNTAAGMHADLDRLVDSFQFKDPKDPARANECRLKGNELFKAKNFEDALAKYNESLRFACVYNADGEEKFQDELAMSYANRSAVFFHLNEFRLCLNDIDQAFKCKYPANLSGKLYERKLQCLLRLELHAELESMLLNSSNIGLDGKTVELYRKKLNDLKERQQQQKKEDNDKKKSLKCIYDHVPLELDANFRSRNLPNAADKLAISYAPDRGFHIRATKRINVGEFLVNEPPYAAVLLGDYVNRFCVECMHELKSFKMNLTPCRQCSLVMYCSKRCEKQAWLNHHKFECRYFRLLAFDVKLTHMEWLAMRIVLKAGCADLLEMKQDLLKHEVDFESSMNASMNRDESIIQYPYRSDSYRNIFNLITNSFLRKSNDLFRRAYVAMFLVKLLIKTGFISSADDENICYIGGLLLRHSQSISCNAHEISRLIITETGKKALANSVCDGIGAGIFALMSMFNHSCDPQVTRNFAGTNCQVRSMQVINENDEIFDNYGTVYAVNELRERKEKLLDQYFFSCQCRACLDDWPLYDKIRSELKPSDIKCSQCSSSAKRTADCQRCLAEFDTIRLDQNTASEQLMVMLRVNKRTDINLPEVRQMIEKMFDGYCVYLQVLDNYKVKRPFRDYNNYQEALKQCLNIINMN